MQPVRGSLPRVSGTGAARMSVRDSLPGALLVALPPMNRGQAESCFGWNKISVKWYII